MITRDIEVIIIVETSLVKGKGEPVKVPSSTREKEGSSINIWARMPSPEWVIIYQKIQKATNFASMNLHMRNVLSKDVVSAIRSKKMSTKKSTPG